jgi:plasmid stabilization system protein ParE
VDWGTVLTAENALKLGEASGLFQRVGVGWSGSDLSRVLAAAFGSGVCAAGGDLIRYDASFLSSASYAGTLLDLPLTVFVEESGGSATLTFFGRGGTGLTRESERKLEAAALQGGRTPPCRTGRAADVRGYRRRMRRPPPAKPYRRRTASAVSTSRRRAEARRTGR